MVYNVFDPGPALSPLIRHFWILEGEPDPNSPAPEKVFPDGCMEMIIHYGNPFKRLHRDGTFETQPASFVIGQIKQYIEIEASGTTGILGIRFQPGGVFAFTNVPANELTGKTIPPGEIFGNAIKEVEERIKTATHKQDRITLIRNFFLKRLEQINYCDHLVNDAIEKITSAKGQINIAGLMSNLKISERHFEKKFNTAVGMSPKLFSRIVRFQNSLKIFNEGSITSFTGLSLESGYYDQAHFTKDFREFSGTSPRNYFNIDKNQLLSRLFLE